MTTDCPPVIAMSPMRRPVAGFECDSAFTTSIVSSRLSVWMTPAWRIAASQMAGAVASEAVCE